MQLLVIAYDNEGALDKRMEHRPAHVESTQRLMAEDKIVTACALMEEDTMVGSTLVTNFETEDEFNNWLSNEPFVLNGVWNMDEIQIVPIKVMPKA